MELAFNRDDAPTASEARARFLNQSCHCVSIDRDALRAAVEREADDPQFCEAYIKPREHLFSTTSVFLPRAAVDEMARVIDAVEAASALPAYRAAALAVAPAIAQRDPGPRGAFMGYDFHLDERGAHLIEINTNAGGAFLNAFLARAQTACCEEAARGLNLPSGDNFDARVWDMFHNEWRLQRGDAPLRRIAIVDDAPQDQYLFPEFLLAQRFFTRRGVDALIVAPEDLTFRDGVLWAGATPVDLVYNRLVDFALADPAHAPLRAAYEANAAVVTPNPHVHALYADKRNLVLLSDAEALAAMGLATAHLDALKAVPRTQWVTPQNAQALWAARDSLFFKPSGGHGAKAVYRGDKITRKTWAAILEASYVAQAFAAPGERMVVVDGAPMLRKMDVRLYAYDGRVLLVAARLYQGQTTNFRTPGGGFAPVLVV